MLIKCHHWSVVAAFAAIFHSIWWKLCYIHNQKNYTKSNRSCPSIGVLPFHWNPSPSGGLLKEFLKVYLFFICKAQLPWSLPSMPENERWPVSQGAVISNINNFISQVNIYTILEIQVICVHWYCFILHTLSYCLWLRIYFFLCNMIFLIIFLILVMLATWTTLIALYKSA